MRKMPLADPRDALWAVVHGGNQIAKLQIVDEDITAGCADGRAGGKTNHTGILGGEAGSIRRGALERDTWAEPKPVIIAVVDRVEIGDCICAAARGLGKSVVAGPARQRILPQNVVRKSSPSPLP